MPPHVPGCSRAGIMANQVAFALHAEIRLSALERLWCHDDHCRSKLMWVTSDHRCPMSMDLPVKQGWQ